MTPQEIFETVSRHLFAQGRRATKPTDNKTPFVEEICAYRSPEGLSCAVGCLIPDDIYSPDMEGLYVYDLFENFPAVPQFIDNNAGLLTELQDNHDEESNWENSNEMRRALRNTARMFELNYDFLSDLKFADR